VNNRKRRSVNAWSGSESGNHVPRWRQAGALSRDRVQNEHSSDSDSVTFATL
jgi:hypothetical protein